jgi:hypothetical protein
VDFGKFHFGSIEIDGITYEHDVVIDRGKVSKRKKKRSRKFREELGHTPLSSEEKIPWKCRRLIIGTGRYGSLPVMNEVKFQASTRKITLLIIPTNQAIRRLLRKPKTRTPFSKSRNDAMIAGASSFAGCPKPPKAQRRAQRLAVAAPIKQSIATGWSISDTRVRCSSLTKLYPGHSNNVLRSEKAAGAASRHTAALCHGRRRIPISLCVTRRAGLLRARAS